MQRYALCWLMLAACGPGAPQDDSTATDPDPTSTTTASTDTTTSSSTSTASTTAVPTTGAPTTDGSTTIDSTGVESSTTGPMPVTSTTGDTSSGESTDTEGSTTGEPGPCCVAPAEPTSTVQAQTPVGARTLPWAAYSVSGGECGGALFLYLYPEASSVGTPSFEMEGPDYMKISVSMYMDMWPNDFIGTGPAEVEVRFDNEFANITGEITILEYDGGFSEDDVLWCDPEATPVMPDSHVSFTIAFKADGWDIAGEVVADYCPAMNQICP
ncbi:hypothetical protein [Nannocystis punicea]|uniref:Uncharacterized protein n=1 Tax=Nannocystis punicea TaxID=2995304 RepID=A0ABY7GXP9_9BACT|nr:hypothetical protein [Nannocystis poenicansa]WAS91751.1 hypothetical protein O0S08_36680 [Nannocystis poenicansa]